MFAVQPLPAQRPVRQHPSAGLAPVEAPEVLFKLAVLVDPDRIRDRVVARPPVLFVPVLAGVSPRPAVRLLVPIPIFLSVSLIFLFSSGLGLDFLSTILAGEDERFMKNR